MIVNRLIGEQERANLVVRTGDFSMEYSEVRFKV